MKYCHERWCRETSLAASYLELFRFCLDKEASVAELMKFTNGFIFWDVSFFRGVHELEVVLSFMDTIYGSLVRGFDDDKMGWKPNRNKVFMINDYYRLLAGSNDSCFP